MNKFRLKDLKVGMKANFSVVITEDMQEKFLFITQDTNPLHIDQEYAVNERKMLGRVVYGMLTASFYSTLAGVYLPGKYCILQEVNTSFHFPVYIGDCLTIEGEIADIDLEFRRITLKAKIKNTIGQRVSKAKIIAGVVE